MIVFGEPVYTVDQLEQLTDDFDVKQLLKDNGYVDNPLDFEDAYLLGAYTLYSLGEKRLDDVFDQDRETATYQSLTALSVFHDQDLYRQDRAHEQIAGITAAVIDYDIKADGDGFLDPNVETAMDNCGTGGDHYRTPNVSTIAALVAAADGVTMCKHGSPGNTDSTGSSDFLEYLGFDLMAESDLTEQGVEDTSFGYSEALNTDYKDIHRQTHQVADLPHMNDIIGPITNPLHPGTHTKRVIGVNHLFDPSTVAEAYRELNERGVTDVDHLIAVRGFVDDESSDGIDEASTMDGGSIMAELEGGDITVHELEAADFGLEPGDYSEIDPGNYSLSKPELGEALLQGRIDSDAQDLIAANAALLFYIDRDMPLDKGTEHAKDILESGKAYEHAKKAAAISRGESR